MKKKVGIQILFILMTTWLLKANNSYEDKSDSSIIKLRYGVRNSFSFITYKFKSTLENTPDMPGEELIYLAPSLVIYRNKLATTLGFTLGDRSFSGQFHGAPFSQKFKYRIGLYAGLEYYLIPVQKRIVPFLRYNFQFWYKQGLAMYYENSVTKQQLYDNYFFENKIGIGARINISSKFNVTVAYALGVIYWVRDYQSDILKGLDHYKTSTLSHSGILTIEYVFINKKKL